MLINPLQNRARIHSEATFQRTLGVVEMRIDHGPGYRVYYLRHERSVIILLAGGDKSTQARDIKTALRLARNL
ncbi:MAG: type II toxin-antitoxin system RelE/ParE family toxin [Syntrophaceae bacterium]|nr:type II toxin-antitoxin system RelE/ParE family toxin [Syntrophaceae bacterium]